MASRLADNTPAASSCRRNSPFFLFFFFLPPPPPPQAKENGNLAEFQDEKGHFLLEQCEKSIDTTETFPRRSRWLVRVSLSLRSREGNEDDKSSDDARGG